MTEPTHLLGTNKRRLKVQKLFHVRTQVKEFDECKDVTFAWFYTEKRIPSRPYAEMIQDYDPTDDFRFYPEGCIDELFSESEATLLKEYLDREYGGAGTTTIEEFKDLPIPFNTMGNGARAVGGGDDFYMLYRGPTYSLPFKVEAYYNLEGCQLIDGSDVYRHRLWIFGADGSYRKQSNKEAAEMEQHVERLVQRAERATEDDDVTMSPRLTQNQLELLGGMARCHLANTGRLPTTVKELADHWYDMSDRLVVLDPPEERATVAEIDKSHIPECIWLRQLEKHPDADVLLAEALASTTPR
jgi:hypothetical protein